MKKTNKILLIIAVIIFAVLVILLKSNNLLGSRSSSPSYIYSAWDNYLSSTSDDPTAIATSTGIIYKAADSASSTIEVDISSVDDIFLTLYLHSTSTPPTFQAYYYYSYDDIASTTGWYVEATGAVSGNVTTFTPSAMTQLTYASSTEYHHFSAPTNRAEKMKIEYTVTGAAADVLLDVNYK